MSSLTSLLTNLQNPGHWLKLFSWIQSGTNVYFNTASMAKKLNLKIKTNSVSANGQSRN